MAAGHEVRPFELDAAQLVYRSLESREDGWGRIDVYKHTWGYCLHCTGVADFYFAPFETPVACFPAPNISPELITAVMRGPVHALLLELRGAPCLHASAVLMNGGAVGFVGQSGCGKSTLAASFVATGHPLISDDVLPIVIRGSDCLVLPGHGQLRLRRSVVRKLLGSGMNCDSVFPGTDKCVVPVGLGWGKCARLSPHLRALYVLDRQDFCSGGAKIQPIHGTRRLVELLRFSYCARAVEALELDHRRFPMLSNLSRRVPLRLLTYQSDLDSLDEVRHAIAWDLPTL